MEEKKKTNKIIPVILGIIIVLLIGLIVKQVIEPNNDSMNNNEENNKTAESTITKSEKESIDNILNHYIDAVEKNAMVLETKYYENFSDGIYELPFDQVSVTLRPESGWFNLEDGVVKDYSFVIYGYVVTLKDNEVTYEKGNKEKSAVEVLLRINEKDATNLDVNSEEVKKLLNIVGIESLDEVKEISNFSKFLLFMKGKQSISNLSDNYKDLLMAYYAAHNNLVKKVSYEEYDFCFGQGDDHCYGITIDDANKVAQLFGFSSDVLEKMYSGKHRYNGMYLFKNGTMGGVCSPVVKHNIVASKNNDYIIITNDYVATYMCGQQQDEYETFEGTTKYIFRKNDTSYYLDTVIGISK